MHRIVLVFTLLCLLESTSIPAHGPERIYIANDDHTDYMWSADEETYRRAFISTLDYYLDLAERTEASLPHEHHSRWNCDGSLWIWTYQQEKTPEEFQRLLERIRDGHISVPMNVLCSVYGCMPTEAVLRSMYYAGRLEREFALDFKLAEANENQTLPYGLGALWAGSGARYSWRGVCNCATRVSDAGDREHEVYWWIGPDSSRVLMKWYSQPVSNQHLGGYAEARNPAAAIDYVTIEAEQNGFNRRYPYDVVGIFGKGWDDLVTLTPEFVDIARAKTTPGRTVIVSNRVDFFEDLESSCGEVLPCFSASFGNEWELLCASMAEVSAEVKRSVENLRSAEALALLVSLAEPDFMASRAEESERTWLNLGLYWEHSWTPGPGITAQQRSAWQRRLSGQISSYVNTLKNDASSRLGALIGKSGSLQRFYVFNPLSWLRSDKADFYTDPPSGDFHIVDLASGTEVPSQIVSKDEGRAIRIWAGDVPPLGYRVYEIRPGRGRKFDSPFSSTGSSLENRFYRITFAPSGNITSLVGKEMGGRQFVSARFGGSLNGFGPGAGRLVVENTGPVSFTLRTSADTDPAHTTRLTLFRNCPRIEIDNEITENFSETRSWSFAFDLEDPELLHEEVGAVIRARLLDRGGHYAVKNARYDWLTLNHFALMTSRRDSVSVTLSSPDCFFMKVGNSTVEHLDSKTPVISVLAGGQVDSPELGIPNQAGDSYFLQRFALTTGRKGNPVQAMRFALEHQNRLTAAEVIGSDNYYPETKYSLISIDNPEVLLWAAKPSEDGISRGIAVRLWSLSPEYQGFRLTLATGPLTGASHTSNVETDIGQARVINGALADVLLPRQIKTYRIVP